MQAYIKDDVKQKNILEVNQYFSQKQRFHNIVKMFKLILK